MNVKERVTQIYDRLLAIEHMFECKDQWESREDELSDERDELLNELDDLEIWL